MGALPRLAHLCGMQRASLLALTAYTLSAAEAHAWGLVARVVDPDVLIPAAVGMASAIAAMSPDSVIVSRAGVREAFEGTSVEEATRNVESRYARKLMGGENVKEGMSAFVEKR